MAWSRRPSPASVPPAWERWLDTNVTLARGLDPTRRRELLARTAAFVDATGWEGCGGLALTEEMQVTIGAHASLLVLGRPERDLYADVASVLVYPSAMRRPARLPGFFEQPRAPIADGTTLLGEAMLGGPVVLAWDAVVAGGRGFVGGNVALHEFAHKLDMRTGVIDGAPPLPTRREVARWAAVCSGAYQRLTAAVATGAPTALDPYGATSPAEFFAVATEAYFTRRAALTAAEPALAAVLDDYYRVDLGPAALAVDDLPDGFALRAA